MTLAILAVAGVASIFLFALKGVLDQVPDVIDSASRARDAWHRFRRKVDEQPTTATVVEMPPRGDEKQPPAAA
ncbi:hypothetical protein AB0K80_19575 [Streptomyces sp. NPDC052682]|uniref:hypothetical protein n=1 Tax=Streptomyces sp. NPDC052682 TaxID=3154954 RepID=UPI00341D50C8